MLLNIGRVLKKILVIISLLYLCYLGYIKYGASQTDRTGSATLGEIVSYGEINPTENTKIESTKDVVGEVVKRVMPSMTLADFRALQDWDESHGYYSKKDYEMYESYGEETLKNLSANGDVKAMDVLASYYIQKDYKPEASVELSRKAAVYGSTSALTALALLEQGNIVATELDKTPEGIDEGMINVMTYYKVAAMRGDPRASIAQINAYAVVYKIRYGKELKPSKEQLEKIEMKAKALYNHLQQERYALGLGEFDNSTHESVKRDYSIN